ncbi:2-oxo-4-hydroxy-4-carboxy-5-ureidoimidazoline decarboxylase [soil metagenome]
METLTLSTLNTMTPDAFANALGGVFEHSPWVAVAVCDQRPFAGWNALHTAMVEAVAQAAPARQLALIRAHPDLAGKAAQAGAVTLHSRQEQSGAGLDRLSAEEYERFHRLNTAYRERFDFPFILAVKGHDKEGVLTAFKERLTNDTATEKTRALAEIVNIARFRLAALSGETL